MLPVKVQISLRFRAGWSESLQGAFSIIKDTKCPYTNNKDWSDNTAALAESSGAHVRRYVSWSCDSSVIFPPFLFMLAFSALSRFVLSGFNGVLIRVDILYNLALIPALRRTGVCHRIVDFSGYLYRNRVARKAYLDFPSSQYFNAHARIISGAT